MVKSVKKAAIFYRYCAIKAEQTSAPPAKVKALQNKARMYEIAAAEKIAYAKKFNLKDIP